MEYLELAFLRDLAPVIEASRSAEPEHIARHTQNLDAEIEFLLSQGFVCLLKNSSVAFLKKGSQQLELLASQNTPEHIAYKVETQEDFEKTYQAFWIQGEASFTLMPAHTIREEDLRAMMFFHLNGAIVQIVWRKNPIFPVDSE